jgi:hypothetical protein
MSAGTGLKATFYQKPDLTGPVFKEVVLPSINFQSDGKAAILKGLDMQAFSARFEGQVESPVTGELGFAVVGDDGVRVWFNGQLVVNRWERGVGEKRWVIQAVAGKRYDVKIEYFQQWGSALLGLFWFMPGAKKSVLVPTDKLFPTTSPTAPSPSKKIVGMTVRYSDGSSAEFVPA